MFVIQRWGKRCQDILFQVFTFFKNLLLFSLLTFYHLMFSMNGNVPFECFSLYHGKKKILILFLSLSVLIHIESFSPNCGLVKEAIPNQSKERYFSSHQALNICQVLFIKVIGLHLNYFPLQTKRKVCFHSIQIFCKNLLVSCKNFEFKGFIPRLAENELYLEAISDFQGDTLQEISLLLKRQL